jgi:hypothetical protein
MLVLADELIWYYSISFHERIKSLRGGVTKLSSTVQNGGVLPTSLARSWVLLARGAFPAKARVTGDYFSSDCLRDAQENKRVRIGPPVAI